MASPDPYRNGHGDTRYRVTHYDLDLTYKVTTNRLDERAQLHVEILEPTSKIDVDLRDLHAGKAYVDGERVNYRSKSTGLVVNVGHRDAGERFVLDIHVHGKPGPVPGTHGAAGWEELTDGSMVGSQPQGAPGWFPCNNDAANKATYRISVTTGTEFFVVANGTLDSCTRNGNATTWVYSMTRPMSPYLATVHVGPYRETELPCSVPVSLVHAPTLDAGPGTAFAQQAEMVEHFSFLFGPYPFDQYRAVIVSDVLEIPLEAQGLSAFGRNFVPLTWENERLVAHELAHQWFGNAVTGARLQDMWLHEGFACYAEWLWSEKGTPEKPSANDHAAQHYADLPDVPHGHTLADPGMKSLFDDWVYKRGALTLHALRATVGDEAFFGLLHSWVADHSGGIATTEEFIDHCRTASGDKADDVSGVLHAWLYERDLPPLPQLQKPQMRRAAR